MDSSYITPFIKSARNAFETLFQLPIEVGAPSVKSADTPPYDVSAIIGLSGDVEGTVVLGFSLDAARRIVSLFTGADVGENLADLSDAVGELVNIVAGGAKAQFAGKAVSISCPSVVVGHSHSVFGAKDLARVVIPCTCDCGDFSIELACKASGKPGATLVAAAAAR